MIFVNYLRFGSFQAPPAPSRPPQVQHRRANSLEVLDDERPNENTEPRAAYRGDYVISELRSLGHPGLEAQRAREAALGLPFFYLRERDPDRFFSARDYLDRAWSAPAQAMAPLALPSALWLGRRFEVRYTNAVTQQEKLLVQPFFEPDALSADILACLLYRPENPSGPLAHEEALTLAVSSACFFAGLTVERDFNTAEHFLVHLDPTLLEDGRPFPRNVPKPGLRAPRRQLLERAFTWAAYLGVPMPSAPEDRVRAIQGTRVVDCHLALRSAVYDMAKTYGFNLDVALLDAPTGLGFAEPT